MPQYYTLAVPQTALSLIRFGRLPEHLPSWITVEEGRKMNFYSNSKDCAAKLTATPHQAFILQVELPELKDTDILSRCISKSDSMSQASDIMQTDHFKPEWIRGVYVYSSRGKKTLSAILNNKCSIEIQISPELYPVVEAEKKKNNREALPSQSEPIKNPSPDLVQIKKGDLLRSRMQTLINTVNCVGVMGKGIAYTFKQEYPAMFKDYKEKCNKKLVQLGKPYLYKVSKDKWIINFPTKGHWRKDSNLQDVENGLIYLAEQLPLWGVTSLAVPPLGCGNGNLDWEDVFPLIQKYLYPLNIQLEIYAPFKELKSAPTEKSTSSITPSKRKRNTKSAKSYSKDTCALDRQGTASVHDKSPSSNKLCFSSPLSFSYSHLPSSPWRNKEEKYSLSGVKSSSDCLPSRSTSFSSPLSSVQPEDKKAIAQITEIRNFLISKFGLSIDASKRQSYLEKLAFYEKLARQAPLTTTDRQKLGQLLENIQVDRAIQLSLSTTLSSIT